MRGEHMVAAWQKLSLIFRRPLEQQKAGWDQKETEIEHESLCTNKFY